jgi:hypothetical protein
MKKNKKGQWIKEMNEPVLMSFFIEYTDRDWLREQALKRKLTISDIIRNAIKYLKKVWK